MKRALLLFAILICIVLSTRAQNFVKLKGKTFSNISEIKEMAAYKLVNSYKVYEEMECYQYQNTINFKIVMLFLQKTVKNSDTVFKICDALKIDGTGRHEILVVGNNRYGAHQYSNIIIAIEKTPEDGRYVVPEKSIEIIKAYTLEHMGNMFVSVPLKGLYRIGDNYYQERTR